MKKALLIFSLCMMPLAAQAEQNIINLPGNAQYRTGSNGSNGNIIIQSSDDDTGDVIFRRLVNPRYGNYQRHYNRIPTNDAASICGHIERDRKRERCVEDVVEERQKLIEKYN